MTERTRSGGPARVGAGPGNAVRAWRPGVPGISEVFHARFTDHAYPAHTHEDWALLIIDAGAVRYDLGRREHGALRSMVTLLPPHVAHNGRSARTGGFCKRVIYLDARVIGTDLVGRAVDQPELADPMLRDRIDQLHAALVRPEERLQAQSRLALVTDRLRWHLRGRPESRSPQPDRPLATRLRQLLEDHLSEGLDLTEAAHRLDASPTHLIRSFTRSYGLPPHRYLTSRRIEWARRLLLEGQPVAEVASTVGFYDQAHLTRHLRKTIGATPAAYRTSAVLPGVDDCC